MKKFLLYSLMLLASVSFGSCSDDDNTVAGGEDADRLFQPMFRKQHNTGISNDPFESVVVDINKAQLYWTIINDAVAYEIKWSVQNYVANGEDAWIEAEQGLNGKELLGHVVVLAPKWDLLIHDLQYSQDHRFAIRALNSFDKSNYSLFQGEEGVYNILGSGDAAWKNDPRNSKWYGYGQGREWEDYFGLTMGNRTDKYAVPNVVQTSEWDKNSFHLTLNRKLDESLYKPEELASIRENFNFVDAEQTILKVDYFTLTASPTTPTATVNPDYVKWDIPESAWGDDNIIELDIDGLSENSVYDINAWDNSIAIKVDASYNVPLARKTKGTPAAPRLIQHVPNATATIGEGEDANTYDISKYNSMELDDIIMEYSDDIGVAENQVFYLEGGKAYHFTRTLSVYKGFTLATNPDDVAKGKRATLYMSGMTETGGTPNTCNFMLGRQPVSGENPTIPIAIDSIRFMDLDVDCPLARNYGHDEKDGSGNYFMNMFSNGMGIYVSLLEWRNCSFQGLIRGFFRIQGNNDFNILELNLIGCDFYNCGYYSGTAGDYAYIFADHNGKVKSNILEKVEVSDCVFYNNPKRSVITDNNRNLVWDASVRWNIDVHHNTFVNFCTVAQNPIMNTRYIPAGSVLGFHDNVIILTKDAADVNRKMESAGWDAREIQGGDGTGKCTFEIYNNWTTNDTEYLTNGQPFAAYALSATSNTPGKWSTSLPEAYPYGTDELVVHLEKNLRATDLMVSPNPKYFIGTKVNALDYHTDNGIDGLYYQQNDRVLNSDIYKSGAGARKLHNGK